MTTHKQTYEPSLESLFINNVKAIYLEISSICNRNCVFCPNNDDLRMPKNLKSGDVIDVEKAKRLIFPESDYNEITLQLGKSEYKNKFGFHLYNEPLYDINLFRNRLSVARKNIPLGYLVLNTNGDFLDKLLLTEFEQLGLNHIHISLYAPNRGAGFTKEGMKLKLLSKCEDLGLNCDKFFENFRGMHVSSRIGGMTVRLDATNFNLSGVGYDRGQTIDFLINKYERKSSCTSPIDQILIDYQGNCLPCCNIHTSLKNYEDYILGNIMKENLFLIYANTAYQKWREGCMHSPPVFDICKSCARGDIA